MKMIIALAFCLVACTPLHNTPPSHAVGGNDGDEWHSCPNGTACREGYACVKDGCEWCGDDSRIDQQLTRCTLGND